MAHPIKFSDAGYADEKWLINGDVGLCEKKKHMQKDPVCGMMVDEKKTKFTSEHEGRVFYFCSPGCKQKFDVDPHRYGHPK